MKHGERWWKDDSREPEIHAVFHVALPRSPVGSMVFALAPKHCMFPRDVLSKVHGLYQASRSTTLPKVCKKIPLLPCADVFEVVIHSKMPKHILKISSHLIFRDAILWNESHFEDFALSRTTRDFQSSSGKRRGDAPTQEQLRLGFSTWTEMNEMMEHDVPISRKISHIIYYILLS